MQICLVAYLSPEEACFQRTSGSRWKQNTENIYAVNWQRCLLQTKRKQLLLRAHSEEESWLWDGGSCAPRGQKASRTPVLERLKNDVQFFREPELFQSHRKHRLTRTKTWPICRQHHKRVLSYQPTKGRNCKQETSQPQPCPAPPFPSAGCSG